MTRRQQMYRARKIGNTTVYEASRKEWSRAAHEMAQHLQSALKEIERLEATTDVQD